MDQPMNDRKPQRNNPQISQITQIQLLQSFTGPFMWQNKPPVIRPIHLALSFPQRELNVLCQQRSST